MVVFDTSNRETYKLVWHYKREIDIHTSSNVALFLVGINDIGIRHVSYEEATVNKYKVVTLFNKRNWPSRLKFRTEKCHLAIKVLFKLSLQTRYIIFKKDI